MSTNTNTTTKETKHKFRTVTDFTDNEYKQQAQNKNFQSIASLVSGYKPTANKALFTVYDGSITKWSKVEDISSATSLKTKYLGGANNIDGVIVNIAKTYIGGNNLSLLETKGDFGGRLNNVPAAGRYIFIRKGQLFDDMTNKNDIPILPQYRFEGHDIEYQFFLFSLPLLLINGAEGMGSGHAQMILGRNPTEIRSTLLKHLKNGTPIKTPKPWFRSFNGDITEGENKAQWIVSGKIEKANTTTTRITEIPINVSVKSYIKKLNALVDDKVIVDYSDLCDPKNDKVLFEIKHTREFGTSSEEELMQIFKLHSKITENYTCIDENNSVVKFSSANEIFARYIEVKMKYLNDRKTSMLGILKREMFELKSKLVFIENIVNDIIIINKKSKQDIVAQLENFPEIIKVDDSYDYLLRMSIQSLTEERIKELRQQLDNKKAEYKNITNTSLNDMWISDLEKLPKQL